MVYAQPRIHPEKWNAQTSLGFWDTNWSPNQVIINKKRTNWIVDFTVPADHRVKMKESKTRNKYLDLARQQKNL